TPLYSIVTLGTSNGAFLASMLPSSPPSGFKPTAVSPLPEVLRIDPGTDIQPGMTLRVTGSNFGTDFQFVLAGQALNAQQVTAGVDQYTIVVPSIEPGFANLVVRSSGSESAPVALHVLPSDGSATQTISGGAFYQKIDVTNDGLDLNHPVMVPVRNARVEVFS